MKPLIPDNTQTFDLKRRKGSTDFIENKLKDILVKKCGPPGKWRTLPPTPQQKIYKYFDMYYLFHTPIGVNLMY